MSRKCLPLGHFLVAYCNCKFLGVIEYIAGFVCFEKRVWGLICYS